MFRPLKLLIALCCLAPATLYAQSAAVPDAPAPQKPAGLTLPSSGVTVLAPPAKNDSPVREKPKEPMVCGAPAAGIYTPENNDVPLALQGETRAYLTNAFARIATSWHTRRHYVNVLRSGPLHIGRVRFAIYPDGSYAPPEVTVSSGDGRTDEGELLAIREVGFFPALPADYHRPLLVCMRFGYSVYPEDMFSIEDEPWLNKAVDNVKKPTAHASIPKVQAEDPEGPPASAPGPDSAVAEPSKTGLAESTEKKEGKTCGGSQDGVYAVGAHYRLNDEDPALLRRITFHIWTSLDYREGRELAGKLGEDGYIRVRFAVRPNGSYFEPEIMHSSGSAEDDGVILSAIRAVDAFPHLPPDKTLPLVLCLSFYENQKTQELQIGRSKKAVVKAPEE